MWRFLIEHAKDYGFLGPIVGIAGLFLGAGGAILFGWTKTLSAFKPPGPLTAALSRVVTLLCAVGIFVSWFLAEPVNGPAYLRASIWLAIVCVVAFIAYVGLFTYCGRFSQTLVDANNQPGEKIIIWGGFWLRPRARAAKKAGETVEAFLRGNNYDKSEVWPAGSYTLSIVVATVILLALLVCGTASLSTAAAATQVALTNKPARQVFSTNEVPGIPPNNTRTEVSQPSPIRDK